MATSEAVSPAGEGKLDRPGTGGEGQREESPRVLSREASGVQQGEEGRKGPSRGAQGR